VLSEDALDALRRLAEAIAWCARRADPADPAGSLWTPDLRPDLIDARTGPIARRAPREPYGAPWEPYHVLGLSGCESADRPAAVEALVLARAQQLSPAGERVPYPGAGLAGGRLVVYFPDANLFDGSAEQASNGFFDQDNMPPWDTWVCYVDVAGTAGVDRSYDSYLVSWVPPALLELVDDAIAVNPEICIQWADELDPPLRRPLEALGLLP
jgi:hypothetical protein